MSRKLMAFSVVSAMAAAGALLAATPAGATTLQPQIYTATYTAADSVTPPAQLIGPHGEKPKEWGVVAVPLGSSTNSLVTPKATKDVGGGTWSYGTTLDGVYKGCYSNYIHPTKKHSASVAIADGTDKDTQNADVWAKAYRTAGVAHTCYTYWGVY
ncbi:lactococcin 972 family bacteriocin [Streptomyces sp. NPDC051041]|uniref:lactococcin 972 family bacteriocin n=1 Tax=Streptomyces sp. NPDC051041 TaxID=3365640 RepID=UPI0037B9359A